MKLLEFHKEMFGRSDFWPGPGQGTNRIDQFCGGVGRIALDAIVTILVRGPAFGTSSLDESVGQKSTRLGIE